MSLQIDTRMAENRDRKSTMDLAIVGMGCLFPHAVGPGAYWANIKHGDDCIGPVPPTHWKPEDYFDADPKSPDKTYAQRGGFIPTIDFNPLEFGLPPKDIEATDTTQLLGLVAAKQALLDAGMLGEQSRIPREKISVILGVTGTLELVIPLGARLGHPHWRRALKDAGVPDDVAQDVVDRIGESYVPWQENSFPGLLGNVVAGRIANKLDLHGTNCVVDAACASSLSAVHLAALELQTGKADAVVTGGADTFNDIFMFMCFSKTPALSKTGDSKPFDANGDGTILGEGLGMIVLKRLADAERDGDTIYAVIKGIGTSSDGKGNAIYAPSADGQKRCLKDAYARAGVTPDTIEMIEAHGTGTKVGDATEASALTEIFGKSERPWCAIGSVKSQIGHTKAAAGAASLIKAALALHYKVLPPTLKVTQPVDPLNAADSPFYVNTKMRPWLPKAEHPRRAGVSAFGFGGSNFHAVLEEYRPHKTDLDWSGRVEIYPIAGQTPQEIAVQLVKVPTSWDDFARNAELARSNFSARNPHRLILVASRTDDLSRLVNSAKDRLGNQPHAQEWHTPEGAYYGTGPTEGLLAVLFPGQGSQSVGMLRELACLFPEMLDSISTVADVARIIYPPTSFDPDASTKQDAALRSTDVAQPAIGAVSMGLWNVLHHRFGIRAEAFAGHSFGELTALAAAGRITSKDFVRLSRLRGELMAAQGRNADAGTMVAVLAPIAEIEEAVRESGANVVFANRNAPRQTVLSGSSPEIEKLMAKLKSRRIRFAPLPVAAAFHSPLVAAAAEPFRRALNEIEVHSSPFAIYSNTTAGEYPEDATTVRDLLGNQLAQPVAFVDEIRAMIGRGVRTFLEVGPGKVLTNLVEAIVAEPGEGVPPTSEILTLAIDGSAGRRSGVLDLADGLAMLAARGHEVQLSAWEAGSRCRPISSGSKPAMTVPLNGANYVQPRPKRPRREVPVLINTPLDPPSMSEPSKSLTSSSLSAIQETLAALQRMQEETARIHKQFLESQMQAQQTLAALVAQQHTIAGGGTPAPILPVFQPPAIPAPAVIPEPIAKITPTPEVQKPATLPMPKEIVFSASEKNGNQLKSSPSTAETVLLGVVAEKTGYPVEMLSLAMSLDSDLGIDSIKRVEILSALQEKIPGSNAVKPEHLGQLHTLQDVADLFNQSPSLLDPISAVPTPLPRPVPVTNASVPASHTIPENLPAFPIALTAPEGNIRSGNSGSDFIEKTLLEVVAEKTGYPTDMLNLNMGLDVDLGIDSIKRVEILSALQDRLPGSPPVKPEHLGRLQTLQDVANLLSDNPVTLKPKTVDEAGPTTKKISIQPNVVAPLSSHMLSEKDSSALNVISQSSLEQESLLARSELIAPKTERVSGGIIPTAAPDSVLVPPVHPITTEKAKTPSMVDPVERSIVQVIDLDLAAGRAPVPLPDGGEIWLVANDEPVVREISLQLSRLGFFVRILPWSSVATSQAGGALAGLVFIAPVVVPSTLPINRLALQWLHVAGPRLRQSTRQGAMAILISVTRLDGTFGFTNLSASADPVPGGLAGIIKTARWEWPELACKAIDIQPVYAADAPAAAASSIIEELLAGGPIEVGITPSHRCTLELARTTRRLTSHGLTLNSQDVILVTGGARGVTAEVSVALATAFKSTLILTGRTPSPTGLEPAWLSELTSETEMKQAIAKQMGSEATPKAIVDQFTRISAQREIRSTLQRLERAGSRAVYFAVNASNGRAVADLLHQVKVKYGSVTGVIHGAGVLADRKIEQLTSEQFDYVYNTKVDGVRNLLELLGSEPLKFVMLFGSITGRIGRSGQLAYASANEVLNKIAQVEARKRSGTRVVAINWGPWDGGMVSPGLRKLFESEGVGLIPLLEGGSFAVQELGAAGHSVEVVAMGPKPNLKQSQSGSVHMASTGRAPAAPMNTPAPITSPPSIPVEWSLAFERIVDIASHPVLRSHVLDGRAVLPMAVHMEWLAHAALHGNPGLLFHGFNDLRITHGVMVEEAVPSTLRLMAGRATRVEGTFCVPVELRGKRRDGREVIHSRAEVILVSALPKAPGVDRPPDIQQYPHPLDDVYRYFLFHGPDLHGIESVDGLTETAFIGTAYPSPSPTEWFTNPLRSSWVAEPLVLDASFQMMILWSYAQHGAGSLPCFLGRYRQYRRSFPSGPTKVVIRVTRDNGSFARADIDFLDSEASVVAQMQDYECVIDPGLNQAFRRNQLGPLVRN